MKQVSENIGLLISCVRIGSPRACSILLEKFSPLIQSLSHKRTFFRVLKDNGKSRLLNATFSYPLNDHDREDLVSHLQLTLIEKTMEFKALGGNYQSYLINALEWEAFNWRKRLARKFHRFRAYDESGLMSSVGIGEWIDPSDPDGPISFKFPEAVRNMMMAGADNVIDKTEEAILVAKVIEAAKPFGERTVQCAVLHYIDGRTQVDIARLLGYQTGEAVGMRLKPVREKLLEDPMVARLLKAEE